MKNNGTVKWQSENDTYEKLVKMDKKMDKKGGPQHPKRLNYYGTNIIEK